jgi:hypothetical protein
MAEVSCVIFYILFSLLWSSIQNFIIILKDDMEAQSKILVERSNSVGVQG